MVAVEEHIELTARSPLARRAISLTLCPVSGNVTAGGGESMSTLRVFSLAGVHDLCRVVIDECKDKSTMLIASLEHCSMRILGSFGRV